LSAGTELEYTPEYLAKILADAIDADHAFNKRLGMTKQDDTLPERFQNEPLTKGPTKGETVDIQKMVDEYYKIHKWED
jgi:aldehyde:ferredoxin oxidoreductase